MKQDETRRKLIDGTIHVIAKYGLDKATTKQISTVTSINEVYIYRCFNDKAHMFAETFESLEQELISKMLQHLPIILMKDIDFKTRCQLYFNVIWKFLLGNRDKSLTYIRYYFSTYYSKLSSEKHDNLYKPVIEKFSEGFLEGANVHMILTHILMVMLTFAVKVFEGSLPDNDDTAEHIFRILYVSVSQYLKN